MEDSIKEETIGTDYLIQSKIGSGGEANVFLVKKKGTNEEYAAKVPKRENYPLTDEIAILNELKKYNNPYIVKIVESGVGDIIRNDRKDRIRQYAILEHASNGCLFDYIYCRKSGLGELKSKIFFSKILEGFKCCHEHNICHRDIKLENILLDISFTPKINDFGFASKIQNNSKLKQSLGTKEYKPPEMDGKNKYDGFKVDIFCLASSLLILTTGLPAFKKPKKSDGSFNLIFNEKYDNFWEIFESNLPEGITLSKEFKNLFNKMISCKPEERPSIDDILADPWFKEVEDMKKNDQNKLKELEDEITAIFSSLTKDVQKCSEAELESENFKSEKASYNTRGIQYDNIEKIFGNNMKPKYVHTPMNMNQCIKIKGFLNPVIFMNCLIHMINDKFDNCLIEPSKVKLKFIANFEEEEMNEGDKIKEEEEIKEEENEEETNELQIQFKLYKTPDGHILRLIQKDGNRKDFLEKFIAISKLVENILNK